MNLPQLQHASDTYLNEASLFLAWRFNEADFDFASFDSDMSGETAPFILKESTSDTAKSE